MKRNTINFAATTLSFALFFTVLLLSGRLSAAGCHNADGCDTSAGGMYNTSPFSNPTYSPSWTDVTANYGHVKGGQYLKFSVVKDEIYVWSTEGQEDVFSGVYASECSIDSDCRTASDIMDKGLRCIGGYCLLPFDTELTLLKGETCSADSELLAYSNEGGFRNQSQLEWKADFTGTVVLLVTNYEYKNGSFIGCQKTSGTAPVSGGGTMDMTTTVKWHRSASEPCTTCGAKENYRTDKQTLAASSAPYWTTVQSRQAVNLLDFLPSPLNAETLQPRNFPNDKWIKPGSYVVFKVTENHIYRWSTCIADFQDTQLTLFKGDKGQDTTGSDSCGQVLAYGDDSKVSYTSAKRIEADGTEADDEDPEYLETYCPAGTRQTVLEWQANFTGPVTLLLSEYNCYQCYPQEMSFPQYTNPDTGVTYPAMSYNNWLNCFYEVVGNFKVDGSNEFVFENGWPVEASSGDPSMLGTFVYPFPLDWQRYDCDTCNGDSAAKISDDGASGYSAFANNTAVALGAGDYVEFALKRGSKYLFKAGDDDAVVTIKKGEGCTGELIAQATGQITYFADSTYNKSLGMYNSDKISVYVSKADCRSGENTLTYSYYTTEGNIDDRFLAEDFSGGDKVVTDNISGLQFVDTGEWAWTWEEAMKKCQRKTVGDAGGADVLQCPPTECSSSKYEEFNPKNENFCHYKSSGADASGNCLAPKCETNYTEFKKTDANKNDPDLQDLFGKCYYSGSTCDSTSATQVGTPSWYTRPWTGCNDGDEYIAAKAKCGHCDEGELSNAGSAIKPNWVCVGLECKSSQNCITIGATCDNDEIGATKLVCPDGYTEHGGKCVSDTSTYFDMYAEVESRDLTKPTCTSTNTSGDTVTIDCLRDGGEAATCPDGTHDLGDGTCEYDGCGVYAQYSDFQNYSSQFVLKKLLDEDPNGCYASASSTSEGYVPCCCSQPIKKVKSGYTQATYDPLLYATSLNPPEYTSISTIGEWTCETVTSCQSGYTLGNHDNHCYKCLKGALTWVGEYECYNTCNANERQIGTTCYKCPSGYTLKEVEGGAGLSCQKECPADAYQDGDTCYVNTTAKIRVCDTENGWVEENGKCRKLKETTSGDYAHVQCERATAELANNLSTRTCDTDNPNSYDCHCLFDRCEDSIKPQDKKVCPQYVCLDARCRSKTAVTPHQSPVNLNGEVVYVDTLCEYQDATGQTCGEAMGGWNLPNINQLYSIVDFDLYDPATSYPFTSSGYNRTASSVHSCTPIPTPATPDTCSEEEPCDDENFSCIAGKCISQDPFGDLQCSSDGNYLCIDGECERNNWYWSSTTVVTENSADGQFVWAVNMQDGRSYFAKKGCTGDECATNIDLSARPHHVICIKGTSLSGIFDSDAPSNDQVFSGWACDRDEPGQALTIYFGIVDKDSKDVVELLDVSDIVVTIPGLIQKGIKYGSTDDSFITDEKSAEIYNNCGFEASAGAPHAFGLQWREGSETAGKEDIAEVIMSLKEKECTEARLADGADPKTDCAVPPYFVTAYGVNELAGATTGVAISPTNRPFVFTNRCGDGYKTNDGTYAENCESDDFGGICVYGNDACQLCAETNMTVSGSEVKACTNYNANPPKCMDGTLQSYYCVENSSGNFVIAEGHTGEGLPCEYYNFAASNIISSSEECDCLGGTFYLYPESGDFNCSYELTTKVCPNYYNVDFEDYDKNAPEAACYICNGCKKERVLRPRCGDSKIQRADCSGYTNCEVVPGADEECDDGNNSDTDACTSDCKLGTCGDGHIQPSLGEVCDSKNHNGWYSTNCTGTMACPGCASVTCGKDGTDPLGPRCGDGKVQNQSMCGNSSAVTAAGYYEDGVFHNYASLQDFYDRNDLVNAEKCHERLTGAAEACDLGLDEEGNSLNGRPVAFEAFRQTDAGKKCAELIDGVYYPVNTIHANYAECIFKYKQFLDGNSGCATDCTTAKAPYCGDGRVDEGEICDDGIPTVNLVDGKYVISSAYDNLNYNGKKYGSCRLDCRGKYDCENSIVETDQCAGMTVEGFCPNVECADGLCPNVGSSGQLYVKGASEECDDGALTGNYGYCDKGCKNRAYCGSGALTDDDLNCIEMGSNGVCNKKEQCDFGETGQNPNKTIDMAYSLEAHGSCIAENDNCTKGTDNWKDADGNDILCCVYGRYCGDGTVDNGSKVGDSVDWKDATKWKKVTGSEGGATVKYDARNLSMVFELTASTATMELDADIPVDLGMRYFLEYNMMPITVGIEAPEFQAGVSEYSETGTLVRGTQYFFTTLTESAGDWYRGKNESPVSGESAGGVWSWYTGTKKVHIVFKMEGVAGTRFFVRALSFYDINHANYTGSNDSSKEMCDPGDGNFVSSSDKYMTDCNSSCKWINYCGDSIVQRSSGCGADGKYNGYTCVNGITYAAEVCDNGTNSTNVYNGCEPGCQELGPHCGDALIDRNSCPSDADWCHIPASGLDKEETCDNGGLNSNDPVSGTVLSTTNYNTCRGDCRPSRCGDGVLDTVRLYDGTLDGQLIEECDCGAPGAYFEATKNQSTVVNGQTVYLCLDDSGNELYNTVSAQRAALCRPNCKISRCGDGILDKGEECDDGNFSDHDSCTSECKLNTVGDGIWAHSRSYLCEELKNISTTKMQKMKAKGVVDCDNGAITCEQLAAVLNSDSAVKTYFESGVLHCCYNQKLGYTTASEQNNHDDHNCEFSYDGSYWKPKDLAVKRCETYAENVSGTNNTNIDIKSHAECVALVENNENNPAYERYDAIEQCERCVDNKCGRSCADGDTKCPNQQQLNCTTKYSNQTDIDDCIEKNKYCNKDTGWNIIGKCGDGKVDSDANEQCDNNIAEETRYYTDLYDGRHNTPATFDGQSTPWGKTFDSGTRWYNGHYCTGGCRGNCSETSDICSGTSDNNCWEEGCTQKLHRAGQTTDISMCGDGFVDTYAGEECDYGNSSHSENYDNSYCNFKCKFNRKDGSTTGPRAKCGDNKIQSMSGEVCDDGNENDNDYCVGDGTTDSNGYVNHCKVSYGSCGDGKITGPGYTFDSKWDDGTLNTNGGTAGPEDCDIQDARTLSLVDAGIAVANLCNANNNCKRVGTCGDGVVNPRFESCDNGTNNATQNVTVNGVTCFKGCKSNPKGGLIKATNSVINGWACDPDHPMTHPETLVRIEIYDSSNGLVGKRTLATTIDISGTDVNGKAVTPTSTVKDCGGGSLHGWTYDPSSNDTAMDWEHHITGPYTVKAYATSLDGTPETEVFIGQKQFVKAMSCGDAYVSKCSSIEVTLVEPTAWAVDMICNDSEVVGNCSDYGLENGKKCKDTDTLACSSITVNKLRTTAWSHNRICYDTNVDGTCNDYGLVNEQPCIDEQCDNGSSNNGDLKDCDSKCQDTKCGDSKVQTQATGTRPDHTSYEECEGTTATVECTSLTDLTKETGHETDEIMNTVKCAGTSEPKCKWNRSGCQIESDCPPLSTAIDSTWTTQGNYKAAHADLYIEYVGTGKYKRNWNGSSWGSRLDTVKYNGLSGLSSVQKQCTFKCKSDFTWDSTKKICVPKTDLKVTCAACTAGTSAVWADTNDSCQSVTKKLNKVITINSDGTLKYTPTSGSGLSATYGTTASTTACNWECNSSSVINGNKTQCLPNAIDFQCGVTNSGSAYQKPAGTKWIPVTFDNSGNPVYGTPSDSLTIKRAINASYGYDPTEAQLVALNINDGSHSPMQDKDILISQGAKTAPKRCYYGCAEGYVYDPSSTKCKEVKCGDGVVHNEHCENVPSGVTCYFATGKDELCDDGQNKNGVYWGSETATKSHCDKYCGSYKACVAAEGASNCAYMKESGYNGRIHKGTEYYCGDGKVQVQNASVNGCGTNGLNCTAVNATNYKGASDLTSVNEQCDVNDSNNGRVSLCNKKLNKNISTYYPTSGTAAPSCSASCTITGTEDGCNYCGDGVFSSGNEACEPGESSATICSRETGSYYSQTDTRNWNFESSSWPSWISASVSSWSLNSSYKHSGSYSYCSNNTGSASSSATMTLTVNVVETGNISFYVYGAAETCCDKLTIYLDGSAMETIASSSASWSQRTYNVSAGNHTLSFTYSKDSSVDSYIDRYCIDDLSAPPATLPRTSQTANPSNKTCNSNCTLGSGACYNSWCGDGVQNGPESCDTGSTNSNSYQKNYHCNGNCTAPGPYCGDGKVTDGEACDTAIDYGSCYVQTSTESCGTCNNDTRRNYNVYKRVCNSSCTGFVQGSYTGTDTVCDGSRSPSCP